MPVRRAGKSRSRKAVEQRAARRQVAGYLEVLKDARTPKVKLTNGKRGRRELSITVGGGAGDWRRARRDFVDINLADPGIDGNVTPAELRGLMFLGLCLGTTGWNGKRSFTELDGCIQPGQLDKLIEALTVAKAEALKLGLSA